MNPYENYSVRALEAWLASSALEIIRIREALEVAKERENPPKPLQEFYVLRNREGVVSAARSTNDAHFEEWKNRRTNFSYETRDILSGRWWVKITDVSSFEE